MASFHFEEAAYSHRCSKIETADEIRTRANRNFQNERFLSNLLQIIIYFRNYSAEFLEKLQYLKF